MRPVVLLAALAGCSGREPEPVDTGEPFVPYEAGEPVAEWTPADFGARLENLVALGFPEPMTPAARYLEFMSHGNEICPGDELILTADTIFGCTTAEGYYYSGVAVYEAVGGPTPEGWTGGFGLGGDFALRYPDGSVLEGGGGITYSGARDAEGREIFQTEIRGTWRDQTHPRWLGIGTSGLFTAAGNRDEGGRKLVLSGGIGVGLHDAFFDDLTFDEHGACGWTPTGEVRLRDERGYWYAWDLGDDCDACGNVEFHGDQDLGELCFDLGPFGEEGFAALSVPR